MTRRYVIEDWPARSGWIIRDRETQFAIALVFNRRLARLIRDWLNEETR